MFAEQSMDGCGSFVALAKRFMDSRSPLLRHVLGMHAATDRDQVEIRIGRDRCDVDFTKRLLTAIGLRWDATLEYKTRSVRSDYMTPFSVSFVKADPADEYSLIEVAVLFFDLSTIRLFERAYESPSDDYVVNARWTPPNVVLRHGSSI